MVKYERAGELGRVRPCWLQVGAGCRQKCLSYSVCTGLACVSSLPLCLGSDLLHVTVFPLYICFFILKMSLIISVGIVRRSVGSVRCDNIYEYF